MTERVLVVMQAATINYQSPPWEICICIKINILHSENNLCPLKPLVMVYTRNVWLWQPDTYLPSYMYLRCVISLVTCQLSRIEFQYQAVGTPDNAEVSCTRCSGRERQIWHLNIKLQYLCTKYDYIFYIAINPIKQYPQFAQASTNGLFFENI